MRKRIGLRVETSRPKPLSTLIGVPMRKLEQDKYSATDPGDSATGDQLANSIAGPNGIVVDPLDALPTDSIGSGQTIYQRLTLAGGHYCPVYSPAFYRRVWFDGLEAFQPIHFTVDGANGCVIPGSTLPTPTIVTASYVKT